MLGVFAAKHYIGLQLAGNGAVFTRRVCRVSSWYRSAVFFNVILHLLQARVEGGVEEAIRTAAPALGD